MTKKKDIWTDPSKPIEFDVGFPPPADTNGGYERQFNYHQKFSNSSHLDNDWPEAEIEDRLRTTYDRHLSIQFKRSDYDENKNIVKRYVVLRHWDSGTYEYGNAPHCEAIVVGELLMQTEGNSGYHWHVTAPSYESMMDEVYRYVGRHTLDP